MYFLKFTFKKLLFTKSWPWNDRWEVWRRTDRAWGFPAVEETFDLFILTASRASLLRLLSLRGRPRQNILNKF